MQNIGLVIIDEAYQPFAGKTLSNWLPRFPHLILMRTLSKLGLAGIRLGYLSAENSLLEALEKIRPPYNVNVLTEASALFMMQHLSALEQQAAEICQERERVMQALTKIEEIQPYPSDANFILIRVQNADALFAYLWQHGILIKNVSKMHYLLQNCLRITIGTPQQNAMLLNTLQQFFKESTS